jgi:RND family efflux transporter MFP subunit
MTRTTAQQSTDSVIPAPETFPVLQTAERSQASRHEPPGRIEPPPRRGKGRLIALLILIAVVLAGAVYWYYQQQPAPITANTAPPPTVTVSAPVHKQIVEWQEFTGQFAAVESVEVRARVSGFLTEIHFTDGQIVKKGDLLFVIDPRPFEIARDSAAAQIVQAQARLDLANRQVARAAELRTNDTIAVSTYDQRLQEMRTAQGALDEARAALRDAQLNLEFSRVVAPMNGRIGRHLVSVGNLVTGGTGGSTTLLTTIVALDPIQFYFDASEADYLSYQRAIADGRLSSARDGRVPAFVRLTDETQWTREGRLDFVDNQIDRGAGTIRVRAIFPNPNFVVAPGQFGRLRMPASEPHDAILVPDEAIVTDQSRKLVMVVRDDGTVEARPVRPGPMQDGLRILRSGLKPDERIVINGLTRARPGATVTPQPGAIEAAGQSGEEGR